jgi:hypothetical protein
MFACYNIPPTSPTIVVVPSRTFLFPPRHLLEWALNPRISEANWWRSDIMEDGVEERELVSKGKEPDSAVDEGSSEGITMRKESSVSRWAERELRFVEPISVSMGGEVWLGESHIPDDQVGRR